jgi:lipoprotein-releasing system ATP-binding protein
MSKKNTILVAKNLHKGFIQGKNKIKVLSGASLEIKEGEIVALVGPSGSGKSTFLQLIGLLDQPDKGEIYINGTNCTFGNDRLRTHIRRNHIGMIYQFHHLLPEFSALENVVIPQMISKIKRKEAEKRAKEVLKYLGLSKRLDHRPAQLSGGEQQRVAIARAIVNRPSLLLADEPTGNLDPHTSKEVFTLLMNAAKEMDLCVLVVTHNMSLAAQMDRRVTLQEGAIVPLGSVEM